MEDDVTEPLKNGDALPKHPALTTAKEIVEYGDVQDDASGIVLHAGLHENEVQMLMANQRESLSHLFRYAIRQVGNERRIFHTRPLAVISVRTRPVEEVL